MNLNDNTTYIIDLDDLKFYSKIFFIIELVIYFGIYYFVKEYLHPIFSIIYLVNLSFQIKAVSFIIIVFLGFIVHELIHSVFFVLFNKNGWKSVKFGINFKFLGLYVNCSELFSMKNYRIIVAMPFIILVGSTLIFFILTNYTWFLVLSFIFCFTSNGDLILLFDSKKINKNFIVKDHPNEIGFLIIGEN